MVLVENTDWPFRGESPSKVEEGKASLSFIIYEPFKNVAGRRTCDFPLKRGSRSLLGKTTECI